MGKAWNTTDFPTPAEDSQKHRFSIQKQIARLPLAWCLLRLSNPKTQLANFLKRICESSTHDLCVLPLQICKAKCDWFLSADVTEIVLVARVRRRYFSAEISDSRKYVGVRRLSPKLWALKKDARKTQGRRGLVREIFPNQPANQKPGAVWMKPLQPKD